ncbi:MAG: FAD-dependent oxidoreductase, partial [Pseudomonadota bacterium]
MATLEVKVPDIGDFSDVPVIGILVAVGDTVAEEDPLIELESDKATMEVPSPAAGKVTAIAVKEGDSVSEGAAVLTLEVEGAVSEGVEPSSPAGAADDAPAAHVAPAPAVNVAKGDIHGQVVVLGSGPGGYTAAFRAADLGMDVVLIEKNPTLGGVCLNVGCIPSKALLHAAKVITEAEEMDHFGVSLGKPKIDIDKLRGWKQSVVDKLVGGLGGLAKARKVTVVEGKGEFISANAIKVATAEGDKTVTFDQCIVAAGSEPVTLPFIPHDDPRVIDSTGALELADIPKKLCVLGGGIIGLEMGTVYEAMGSEVTVVEFMDQLIPGCDKDIVKPLHKRMEGRFAEIRVKTKVTAVKAQKNGLKVTMEGPDGSEDKLFDKLLVS